MNFKDLAAERYSTRRFKNRPVEQEKIDLVLEAARLAPTAANKQPQRILVITGEDALARVDKCTACRFAAPLVFLVGYDTDKCWIREKYDGAKSGEIDASIVTTHMMLQAADIGLGTTWVMHFDPVKAREEFSLPANIIPVAFLPTGYPADDAAPSDRHTLREPPEKLAAYSR
ncbi:MAG: nitroreductase family protein [Treponema sp.]|jgi:nitroreductase|nr:nitroreductase family protein [Treponema sp.]